MLSATEEHIQQAAADWLDLHAARLGFQWFHVPGGGHMSLAMGRRRKRMGAKAGTPDIIVMFRGGKVLQIEMKAAKGRLSKSQREWRGRSRELGIPYATARSADDVRRLIVERVE